MSAVKSILVVDDDPDIRETVTDVLLYEGYQVETASDGLEALRKLHAGQRLPDVILLDVIMPGMDGWAFMAELRKLERFAGISVIVFTAYADAKAVATSLNAAGYLNKPLRMDQLLEVVRR